MIIASAAVAYLVGARRAARHGVAEGEAKRPRQDPAPAEGAPASVRPRDAGPERRPAAQQGGEQAEEPPVLPPPISAPPVSAPKAPTVVPPAARPEMEDDAAIAKIAFEDEEEVDPTRVGRMASGPPVKRQILQPPVKLIVFDPEASTEEPPHATSLFLVSATAQTDKGLRRKRNEDCLGVLESKNLFIVADGMGGYAGGDQASKTAVETVALAYESGEFEGEPHEGLSREVSELARAIQMANATILETAARQRELEGMGTTVCAVVFSPTKRRVTIGHVGDSRCYRLRDGVFTLITADHTMAELGVKGPESTQLSRAVGIWPTVQIDVTLGVPETGDVFLLCSDGLTKMLPDDLIANVLRNEEDPKKAVERLIFFANARGGKDNITVVLVRVVPPDWKPKPSEPFTPSTSPPPLDEEVPSSKGPPAGASGRFPLKKP